MNEEMFNTILLLVGYRIGKNLHTSAICGRCSLTQVGPRTQKTFVRASCLLGKKDEIARADRPSYERMTMRKNRFLVTIAPVRTMNKSVQGEGSKKLPSSTVLLQKHCKDKLIVCSCARIVGSFSNGLFHTLNLILDVSVELT